MVRFTIVLVEHELIVGPGKHPQFYVLRVARGRIDPGRTLRDERLALALTARDVGFEGVGLGAGYAVSSSTGRSLDPTGTSRTMPMSRTRTGPSRH